MKILIFLLYYYQIVEKPKSVVKNVIFLIETMILRFLLLSNFLHSF